MEKQKKAPKVIIEYGMENLKNILNDILVIYIGEKKDAR